MIRTGILGARGYSAGEALRWLVGHPEVELTCLMARVEEPEPVANSFAELRGLVEIPIAPIDLDVLAEKCDAVFLAVPHTTALEFAPRLVEAGIKVIDLSADFRFDAVATYEATYGFKHTDPELNARFAYALPALFADEIPGAAGLACPGCYPTASLLALAPLMSRPDEFDVERIVIDALSGVSGAGRKVDAAYLFVECNESARAYGVAGHRHRPEIEEKLGRLAEREIKVTFTPHLIPMNRGILATSTIALRRETTTDAALEIYREYYAGRSFVRVLPPGRMPATADVAHTNFCDLGVQVDAHSGVLIVSAAIDNLAKGASSQAIQAMNLLYGLPETLGLLPGSTRKSHV